MHPDLERLIQLQTLDSRVAEARRLQATIPETQRALDDRLEGARAAVAAAKERLAANNASRRERLKEFDLTEAELARLHGPVGIYIGSRTPPEIAISILAEVTAAKNGVSLPTILQVEGAKAAREIAANATSSCAVPHA